MTAQRPTWKHYSIILLILGCVIAGALWLWQSPLKWLVVSLFVAMTLGDILWSGYRAWRVGRSPAMTRRSRLWAVLVLAIASGGEALMIALLIIPETELIRTMRGITMIVFNLSMLLRHNLSDTTSAVGRIPQDGAARR